MRIETVESPAPRPGVSRASTVRRALALAGRALVVAAAGVVGVVLTGLGVGSLLPMGLLAAGGAGLLAFRKRLGWGVLAGAGVCLAVMVWRASLTPRHDRSWEEATSVLPRARVEGEWLVVDGVREFSWHADGTHTAGWTTRRFGLSGLRGADLIVEPFSLSGLMAHTMISFDFGADGRLVLSIEARKEEGETYGAIRGGLNAYELIYVLTTEEDAMAVRARAGYEMIAYPTRTDPLWLRAFLLSLCAAANNLHERPRFYHIIRDNCTTAWLRQADHLSPEPIGLQLDTVLNGRIDRLLMRRGVLDVRLPVEAARSAFRVDTRVLEHLGKPDFSEQIRAGRPR